MQGCYCRYQIKQGKCNFAHVGWGNLSDADRAIWKTHVAQTADTTFIEGLSPAPHQVADQMAGTSTNNAINK
eukprot:3779339-Ditylum_brightwellii.AAC.1